ncbi:MAG TPA: trigger factor [Gammaproteobacteria bacterium]|nr:trigger factor [Gammaproteobacteria bacterium]|tara:strand:- start:740 stop:2071 length:1332 start_codon:yes stop_codon:yes gene_type:complete
MQVSVKQSGDLEREMTVKVPEERIAGQVKDRLRELSKTVKVDGFRPGKVPFSVVRRRFGGRVREEVLSEVLRSSFSEAMTQEDLKLVGEPAIEPQTTDLDDGLSYTATFEVYPTIVLAPIEKLILERPVCEIRDADIDRMVETLRDQHKAWQSVDRESRDGDRLTIDFVGKIAGEVFEGGEASDFQLILGTGHMIDGFEDGLVGTRGATEAELNLTFPPNYQAENLAGKEARFLIKIKSVEEPVLPELDEEFYKKFGVESGEREAFRLDVREKMEHERTRALQRRFNANAMDAVAAANDLVVPRALVESEIQRLQQQAMQSMLQNGGNPGDFDPSKMGGVFEESAKKRVKLGLLMAEMIKCADIKADASKVRGLIESMAESYEDSSAVVKWYYDDPKRLHEIEAMCLEDEAVTWIAERAEVNEVDISFDDLMNPGQTDLQTED